MKTLYLDLEPCVIDFFDFYAMYELYMRVGGFREEGYSNYPVFINEDIFQRIKYKYEETVENFYTQIYNALCISISSELVHFPSRCRKGEAAWGEIIKKTGLTEDQLVEARDNPEDNPEAAFLLFHIPKWSVAYGGKKWASAAKLLVEAKKLKTIHQKVGWCDRVLDLYHNSGHLLNKTDFASLSVKSISLSGKGIQPLTLRAKSRSVLQFLPYCSPSVRNLILPRKHLLDTV